MVKSLRDRLFSYRTLYVLCFIALNAIEFLKASQTGSVWYVAVNCTGPVMMVILFSAYPLKDFRTKWNLIYSCVCALACGIVYFYWTQHKGYHNVLQRETFVLNVWWIGILVKYLFDRIFVKKTLKLKLNKTGMIWVILSVLMIASVSQRIWPLWYLLMFGAFYLTEYSPEQSGALREGMADGTIISFFGIQIYAYGFRPYDTVRYVGAYDNSNSMALFYLVVYCMVLYKLYLLEKRKGHPAWKLFYLIGAGGLLCFQMFTLCRTAWLMSAIVTFVYGLLYLKRVFGFTMKKVLVRAVALGLATAFTFLPVYETIRWLPTILHYRIWYDGEYDINKVHSFDPPNSDKYVSLEEFLDAAVGRVLRTLNLGEISENDSNLLKAQISKAVEYVELSWSADESTRIRMSIYKAYLEDMTWIGNPPGSGFYTIGDTGYQSWHAQNLWIQVGYTYGILAGVCSLVLTVFVWKARCKHYKCCIPLLITIVFFGFGLTEIVWNLGQIIMFLMYFVQHPTIFEEQE